MLKRIKSFFSFKKHIGTSNPVRDLPTTSSNLRDLKINSMSDLKMALYINYQKHFLDNFSCVSTFSESRATIIFEPEDWAPGVWAGTEGLVLVFQDRELEVVKVDFEGHRLECIIL